MSAAFQELHLDQLVIHPKNVRRDVGNVVELANSITAQGILQPLVVAPALTKFGYDVSQINGARYTIIAGHRRHAAAQLANVDSLPCIIRDDINTEARQLEAMLVENTQRTDLTITEEAAAYQSLLEFDGYTIKSVAKATGRSQSLVRSRVALTKLSEDARDKIEDRTLNIDQALVLVDFTGDDAATKRLLKVADKPSEWAFQLAKEQKMKAWLENLPRLTAELQGAGVEIIERPAGQTWEWTGWSVAYQPLTVAEAVAGGWSAICDDTKDDITWVKARIKAAAYTPPPMSPEEIAASIRVQELNRGLATAAEVRTAFLKNAIQHPAADTTKELLREYVLDRHDWGDLAPWLGVDHEEIDEHEVVAAVDKLNIPQLVTLMHIDRFEREIHMTDLGAWDDSRNTWQNTKGWRGKLQESHGYQWTEAEKAALNYHQEEEDDAAA